MDALIQAKKLIEKSQNILLFPCLNSAGDSLSAAFALFFTLKKLGKNVNIVSREIPEKFHFLSELNSLPSRDFVISIDTSGKDISEMRYEKNERDLKIYLTLSKGGLGRNDISFPDGEEKIQIKKGGFLRENLDLLITLSANSLENLGETFSQNSEVFYKNPILNVDNHPDNENFGEVNLVEMTSSVSEIITNLIQSMEPEKGELLDERVASYLLTGIICSSQNFRNPKTRPKTFATSALLIEKGACHQKIIQHLYKQKSVSQIKLLGRILEKLNFDGQKDLYWATLSGKDFEESQASSKDLSFALEEMKFNFRYLPNLLVLWESYASPLVVKGIFYSSNPSNLQRILENFEGVSRGEGILFLVREKKLSLAEERVLKIL